MTKKKTPTPLKKVETKKATAKGKIPYAQWLSSAQVPTSSLHQQIEPPAGETRVSELEAENYALKTLLSKKQSEDMSQGIKTAAPSNTILDSLLGDMDKNLSRFYNSMNTLDSFADRLKPSDQAQMPIGPAPLPPSNIIGRMERLLSDFNHLNNRLEATNNYLSEIV